MSAQSSFVPTSDERAATKRVSLPLQHSVRPAIWVSLIIALLTLVASIGGLMSPDQFYPTEALKSSSMANDVMTLLIGLPVLLLALLLVRGNRLLGLLVWPGALLYGTYNYISYLYVMPFSVLWPVYLLIVVMSVYTIIGIFGAIDASDTAARLSGRVPERWGGGALLLVAVLILGLAAQPMIAALTTESLMTRADMGLAVADVLFAAAWLIGGILLWRRQPPGYVGATGLLFQGVMLFVGLIGLMIVEPLFGGETYPLSEIVTVILLGLPIYVPFWLFVRGVWQADTLAAAA